MQFSRALIVACAIAVSPGVFAADPIDLKTLAGKEVRVVDLTRAGSVGKTFAAATIIDAPIATVCGVLQQYDKYPAFMPNTQSTVVSQSGAGFSVIDVTLKLPMGKIKKYRLRMEPKAAADSCKLSWKMVPWPGLKQEETIADTSGQWQLTPLSPSRTAVRYSLFTDPGPIPFGLGWIVDSLSKDSIPQTLEAVRARATR